MKIEIKNNDAFRVLQDITRDVIPNLEDHIISRLKSERLFSGDVEDCGQSLNVIAESNGMHVDELIPLLFPNVKCTEEIPELSKYIIFMGSGSNDPCPECGCELHRETEGHGNTEWTETECSNPDCEFADTTEPDWDIRPGGYDHRD